jgi:hypothetical protein
MLRYILSLFILLTAFCQTHAQEAQGKKLVVIDIETKVPMRGVIVSTKTGYRDTTNWRGICHVPAAFDTLTVFKHNYIPERLIANELKDTTALIPSGSAISEVTVWGKNNVNQNIKEGISSQPLPNPSNASISYSFDFANLIDRRGRRDRKHLKSVKNKFQEMDVTGDPIVDAYNRVMQEKQLEAEEQEKKKEKEEKQLP